MRSFPLSDFSAPRFTSAVALTRVLPVGPGAHHALLDLGLVDEAAGVARVSLQLSLDFF